MAVPAAAPPSARRWTCSLLALLVALPFGARAQGPSLEGHWEGAIEVPGSELSIDVDFAAAAEGGWTGDISIPAQNARDLPLRDVRLEGGEAAFAIQEVPGEPTFTGTLSADGNELIGRLTQGGVTFPFRLARAATLAQRARTALDDLDPAVDKALADFEVPGLGLAVVVEGEVVLARGYGLRDVEGKVPVTADTLFAIGSCTKAFTTALLGTLVDEGRLEWDRPVREYLPEFRLQDEHATARLTVRDLVTHRSGLPRHDALWYNAAHSRPELVERLRHLQPFADLRERYHYQNLMYLTAGYLAERITGQAWEELARQRLLDPLGMSSSNLSVEDSQRADDFAWPYGDRDKRIERIPFRNIDAMGPAGSINSSAVEMTRWLLLVLGEGEIEGRPILQPSTAREMLTPQIVTGGYPTEPEVLLESYGMGWALEAYRGHYRVHHGGGIDGFSAMVSVLPLDRVGVVALANLGGTGVPELVSRVVLDRILGLPAKDWLGEALARKIASEAVAEEGAERKATTRKEGTQPAHPLEAYAAEYEHPGYGMIRVERTEVGLQATYNRIATPLEHWHYEIFEGAEGAADPTFEGTRFRFGTSLEGEVDELVVSMDPEVDDVVFARRPDPRLFDPAYLERFTGVYALPNQEVSIELKGNALTAALPGQPVYTLVPRRGTRFGLEGLTGFSAVFVLDERGERPVELQFHQPNGVFVAKPKGR